MKTPPFLLGAALLFWGWQSELPLVGLLLAVGLESARWVKVRWDFSPQDFNRIWTFCTLLFLASAVYAFTSNDAPSAFSNYFANPTISGSHIAGTATSRSVATWIRWQPMLFFLFVAAQTFNGREGVPVETVSLLLRLRWKRRRGPGAPETSGRTVNVSYPYFGVCLLAACAHASESRVYFWGLAGLLAWALWPQASPRCSRWVWAATLVAGIALGFCGTRGLGLLQRSLENLNPQWPFRWSRTGTDPLQSRTALGRIGRLKLSGQIIIRLEVKEGVHPSYLREASYRDYHTQSWYSGTTSNDFTLVMETNGTYVLVPEKTNRATASIACYLPSGGGLLPLPSGCGQFENHLIYGVQKNTLGAVLVEGPGLVLLETRYGPGPTLDDPPTNADVVPGRDLRETNALDEVIAELQPEGHTRDEKLQLLQAFFLKHFTYSTWQGPLRQSGTNETPLTQFLLHSRRGHCEYFATAGTLLLRRLGIPARYAVGYAVHEGAGKKYVVRERDGHAWCLAWNPATGAWEDFDPTPPVWVKEEASRASVFQPLSDLWSRLKFEVSKLRWGQSRLREYVLWGLLPILALLLYQILFRSQRRRRRPAGPSSTLLEEWPGSDSEFYLLEAKVRERGLPRAPNEPLSRWLARAATDPALTDLQEPLQALLRLHYRLRFDPLGLDPAEREALRREATACLARL